MVTLNWNKNDWGNNREGSGVTHDGIGEHPTGREVHGYEHGSITRGLVGYFPLDTGSGTTATNEGSGPDGTFANGPSWSTTSKVGNHSVKFQNANKEHIDIPQSFGEPFRGHDSITFAAWVRRPSVSTSAYQGIITEIHTNASNVVFEVWWDGSTSKFTTGFFDGAWHKAADGSTDTRTGIWIHLVGTYDGEIIRLYKDGSEVGSLAYSASLPTPNGGWAIGRRHDEVNGTADYWDGLIDDVRIYDRALSSTEVTALHSLTTPSVVHEEDTLQ